MAEERHIATVGIQAVAEQGNLIGEFRKILENTSKALMKEGAVTIHADTSEAIAEMQAFIKETQALLKRGLGDVDLGKLAQDFSVQMSAVQGEVKGISEQIAKLNELTSQWKAPKDAIQGTKQLTDELEAAKQKQEALNKLQKDFNTKTRNINNISFGVDETNVEKVSKKITTLKAELISAQKSLDTNTQNGDLLGIQESQQKVEYLKRAIIELQAIVDDDKGVFNSKKYDTQVAESQKALALLKTGLKEQIKDNDKLIAQLEEQKRLQQPITSTTSAQPIQQTAEQAVVAATNVEKLEQNLTDAITRTETLEQQFTEAAAKAEILEQQVADINAKSVNANVKGTVDVGNTVKVTGDGGQLALEKTLKATYHIQQNMVKILSEINSKMVSGANAATTSYEQLKSVMKETVEAAKQLGTESIDNGVETQYAMMKNELQEIINLKKRLPNAGENETKTIGKQIEALYKQVGQRQELIDKTYGQVEAEQALVNILRKQIKLEESKNKDAFASGGGKKTKLESKYNKAANLLRPAANNTLIDLPETQKMQELIQHVLKYDQAIADAGGEWKKLSSETKKGIKGLVDEFNKLTATQQKALKNGEYNEYNATGKLKGALIPFNDSQKDIFKDLRVDSEEYKNALVNVLKETRGIELENAKLDATGKVLTGTYRDQDKNLQRITATIQDNVSGLRVMRKEMQTHQSVAKAVFEPFGNKLKEIFRYFSAYMVVMRFFNAFKEGIQYVRELNTALTEMQLVTSSTADEMENVQKQIQGIAASVASTNTDIAQSATDWARLGYSMSDALELAGVSAQYAKVGFTDVATASENLTATMQAFYSKELSQGLVDAGDLAETITDKFVDVGNKFASSAEGLGRGMTEAGSALVAANNSLDESLALITAGKVCLNYMETCYYRTHLIALIA